MINILLALRQRDRTGQGCHLDIAMADAMFTFAWHALASGHATGQFPRHGRRAADRRLAALPALSDRATASSSPAARWSSNSGSRSPRAIGLAPSSPTTRRDPAATKAAVAEIIAGKTADEWRPVLAAADCCATIVATLEEALRDPHFVERGLFAHQVAGATGATMPALPVPIDPAVPQRPGRGESGAEARRRLRLRRRSTLIGA